MNYNMYKLTNGILVVFFIAMIVLLIVVFYANDHMQTCIKINNMYEQVLERNIELKQIYKNSNNYELRDNISDIGEELNILHKQLKTLCP